MIFLITGAAGFIGSHLCEKLVMEGNFVIGVDNFDPFYPAHIKESNLDRLSRDKNFRMIRADIRDAGTFSRLFMDHKIDVVIHLAAKAGVRPSISAIGEYYDVNVGGTLNLLESMRTSGVQRMIFASSSSVYGNNTKTPFSESDSVDNPISPYASTKKSGELLCYVYHHLHGFDITCLRFFTVFGPRQRPDLAIHKFTRLIDLDQPLPFYGNGNTARDYTFIADIIDGIACAVKNLGGYRLYNLGESRVTSLKELVATIEEAMGKKARLQYLPAQPGDVEITFADISKARSEIGYKPVYDMKTGISRFVDWYHENKQLLYP